MTGAEVEATARQLIGVRYRHQGRSRDAVDCIGLVIVTRDILGLPNPELPVDYAPLPIDDAMLVYCKAHMVSVTDMQPGDVVCLQYKVARHMGILGTYPHGGLSLLHARSMHPRKVDETAFNEAWRRQEQCRVIGCFRFREVAA
ncbi:NlpC/P60 family protein [Variovorax sp. PAMC 28711]|uniref:NlpC/P60 family protein n=1 Tax=Variovorax sp. PAMC 28711 TaxID=1795631 RepID=UPI00078B9FC7|nr:NlpC/P60 family protein [Variovorax sp. PAMC 28711]AMM23159.1 hypothetical protein AX767_01310 [Variovorax sp. PAMC 28711]